MKIQNRQKLVVVAGPTASGKTSLARALCREYNGYIISADSRQVYRYLDIGTGKIDSHEELSELIKQRNELIRGDMLKSHEYVLNFDGVSHYMIDLIDPLAGYNAALYQKDVYDLQFHIQSSASSDRIPFLVGGTGLYIDGVVDNWRFPPGETDHKVRASIEREIGERGLEHAWRKLIELDPGCESFVQRHNQRRVVRALEYVLTTGKKFSEARGKGEREYEVLKVGIMVSREELYRKIDARVQERLALSMIDEVRALHEERGLGHERLRSFGLEYRVISDYLRGVYHSREEMSQKLQWNIHDYARRQLTWFRKDKEIQWIKDKNSAAILVRKFLS